MIMDFKLSEGLVKLQENDLANMLMGRKRVEIYANEGVDATKLAGKIKHAKSLYVQIEMNDLTMKAVKRIEKQISTHADKDAVIFWGDKESADDKLLIITGW